jgi:hypothetical protein
MGGSVIPNRMSSHSSTQAEDTAAILQQAADGVPVLIPGAFEVRVGRLPARPVTAAVAMPHAPAAGLYDRERLEHEREGGGAPSERTGTRHANILSRLWRHPAPSASSSS